MHLRGVATPMISANKPYHHHHHHYMLPTYIDSYTKKTACYEVNPSGGHFINFNKPIVIIESKHEIDSMIYTVIYL